jgi:hypothetical protein
MSNSEWHVYPMVNAQLRNVLLSAVSPRCRFIREMKLSSFLDDYWEQGYGRIIMVPRVKLAYDKVCHPRVILSSSPSLYLCSQKVYDIIHPERRNLTAIRGYKRIGGLPDDPRTDPQDRSWYGPHDRLFTEEEDQEMTFQPGPKHGMSLYFPPCWFGLACPSPTWNPSLIPYSILPHICLLPLLNANPTRCARADADQ